MKRSIQYIFLLILLAVFTGCIKENPISNDKAPEYPSEGKAIVHMSAVFPVSVDTKAMADLPSISLIRVAVFGSSGFLKEVVDAENVQAATTNGNATLYRFDVKLSLTDSKNLRVHVFANCATKLPWKYEGVVMCGSVYTTGNQDAYWARFTLPNGIALKMEYDDSPEVQSMVYVKSGNYYVVDDEVTDAFCGGTGRPGLPMLRNFAKISVQSTTPQLTLDPNKTMTIINMPDRGSVAPYDASQSLFMSDYKDYSYDSLRVHYPGYTPDSMQYINTDPASAPFYPCAVDETTGAVSGGMYMFERPKPSGSGDSPSYVIIHGKFRALKEGKSMSDWKSTTLAEDKRYPNDVDNWLVPVDQAVDGYYKIDFMDDDGYYAVLRNFRYHLRITGVSKAGAETPADAGSTGGSGDISTSTEAHGLTDISNGYGRIAVSYVERTFVNQQTVVELKYKFIPDVEVGDGTLDNRLKSEGGKVEITIDKAGGASPVNVISNTLSSEISSATGVTLGTTSGTNATGVIKVIGNGNDNNDAEGYRMIKFTTNAPSSQDQAFQVIHIKGWIDEYRSISRDVTFYLMEHQTMSVSCVADNPDPHFPINSVEDVSGQGINLNINIPTQLPESMFPLVFTIESDKLSITPNITAAYHDNLPVESGESICTGKTGKKTFHYNYTLSYADYNALNEETTGGKTFTLHFKTNMDDSASTIYVANEYFNLGSAPFTNYSVYNFSNVWFSNFTAGANTNVNVTFKLDEEDPNTSRTITVQLEGLRPQTTTSPWTVVDEGAGLYTYTYSNNSGVGGKTVTLPVKTLAAAQHTGSYSVTLSADGANGVPIYRQEVRANTPKYSDQVTFTNSSPGNVTTNGKVSVSFNNAAWNSNAVRFRSSYYNAGYMEVSVPEGYSLIGVTFSFSNGARNLSPSTGTFSLSGNDATWVASEPTTTVTLTNTSTNNYCYIKTITASYIKLD